MSHSTSRSLKFDAWRPLLEEVTECAISIFDLNGFILTWNSGAQQLKGYTAEEIIGQHFSKFYTPEDIENDRPGRILIQVARDGRLEEETWLLRKDGSRFLSNIVITALHDESGKLRGFGEVARAITGGHKPQQHFRESTQELREAIAEHRLVQRELREMQAQLEIRVEERTRDLSRAISELERANRLKDDFLATVSHELLTPLTTASGWLKMLQSGGLSERQVEHAVDVIDRSLSAQRDLIDDLLNVSRIISGKLTINPESIDPAPIIQGTIDSLRPSLETKQLHVEFDFDRQIGSVLVDPVRFQQIVWNLLTNAVKFTPREGSIRVQLKRGEGKAILRVSDTGEGIAQDFLPYVFDRFRQGGAPRDRRYGGLGLGLSIVRHLVELHGGTVTVNSRGPGQGSTFAVYIPTPSTAANPQLNRRTAPDPSLSVRSLTADKTSYLRTFTSRSS
jgi:PAS domain S-box-containing protein